MKSLPHTHTSIHLTDDTRIVARSSSNHVWIELGSAATIHVANENQLGELAGAIDQAASLLER